MLISKIAPLSLRDKASIGTDANIMKLLLSIGGNLSARSILKSTDLASFKHEVVEFLLVEYNGDSIFELTALVFVKEEGVCRLDGMD